MFFRPSSSLAPQSFEKWGTNIIKGSCILLQQSQKNVVSEKVGFSNLLVSTADCILFFSLQKKKIKYFPDIGCSAVVSGRKFFFSEDSEYFCDQQWAPMKFLSSVSQITPVGLLQCYMKCL